MLSHRVSTLRERWRRRRLDLSTLPGGARRLVVVALAACAVLAAVILALGTGWWSTAGGGTSAQGLRVPGLVWLVTGLGWATAAAVLTAATLQPGARRPRLVRRLVAGGGTALALLVLRVAASLAFLASVGAVARPAVFVVFALGWASLVAAAVVAFGRLAHLREGLLTLAAGAPFACSGAAFAVAVASLERPAAGAGPVADLARALQVNFGGAYSVVPQLAGVVVLVWAMIEASRAGRDGSAALARTAGRWPWLLPALLTAKLVWVALGYAGALPGADAADGAWAASRGEGWAAWALAVAYGCVAAWWLTRANRRRLTDEGVALGARVAVAGLSIGFVLGTLAFVAGTLWIALADGPRTWVPVTLAWTTGLAVALVDARTRARRWALACGAAGTLVIASAFAWQATLTGPPVGVNVAGALGAAVWLAGNNWLVVAGVGVTAVAGVALVVRADARRRSAGVFLLLVSAWVVPYASVVAFRLATGRNLGERNPLGVTQLTLDTVLTVVVGAVAVAHRRGRQSASGPFDLAMVLVVSTAVAHADALVPSSWEAVVFYAAFGFAAAYAYLFDAQELNRPGPGRPARVLTTTALAAGALAAAALGVAAGQVARDQPFQRLAAGFLAAPVAASVVMARAAARNPGANGIVRDTDGNGA